MAFFTPASEWTPVDVAPVHEEQMLFEVVDQRIVAREKEVEQILSIRIRTDLAFLSFGGYELLTRK